MRKYRSHKVVEAAEVRRVTHASIITTDDAAIDITSLGNKGLPAPGDFVVRYEDGHLSWSPRKAFLDGYSPIDHSGADYQPETPQP